MNREPLGIGDGDLTTESLEKSLSGNQIPEAICRKARFLDPIRQSRREVRLIMESPISRNCLEYRGHIREVRMFKRKNPRNLYMCLEENPRDWISIQSLREIECQTGRTKDDLIQAAKRTESRSLLWDERKLKR